MTVAAVVAPRLLGPAVMVAAAIVVRGYTDVGDGFSAGVVLALAIALRYITLGVDGAERGLPVLAHAPAGIVAGLAIMLVIAFAPVAFGEPPLSHVPGPGDDVVEIGTLELTTAVAFDLALLLLVTSSLVVVIHHLARLVEVDRRASERDDLELADLELADGESPAGRPG